MDNLPSQSCNTDTPENGSCSSWEFLVEISGCLMYCCCLCSTYYSTTSCSYKTAQYWSVIEKRHQHCCYPGWLKCWLCFGGLLNSGLYNMLTSDWIDSDNSCYFYNPFHGNQPNVIDWLFQDNCCHLIGQSRESKQSCDGSVLDNSSSTASSANIHVVNERPWITFWVIDLNTSETIGPIKTPNDVNLLVYDSYRWPSSWSIHGGDVGPLVR